MPSDIEVLNLVVELYGSPAVAINDLVWYHVDTGISDDGVYWGCKRLGDTMVVVNRGTVSLEDFSRDIDALSFNDPQLGTVHAGFFRGMRRQWQELRALLGDLPWIAAGHSLGAARACLLAGLGAANGRPPVRYVRFGEPRPGMQQLQTMLAQVPGISYQTMTAGAGHDLVPDVPFFLPPLYPYVHPQPLTALAVQPAPPPDDPWGPYRYHHVQNYMRGLQSL